MTCQLYSNMPKRTVSSLQGRLLTIEPRDGARISVWGVVGDDYKSSLEQPMKDLGEMTFAFGLSSIIEFQCAIGQYIVLEFSCLSRCRVEFESKFDDLGKCLLSLPKLWF